MAIGAVTVKMEIETGGVCVSVCVEGGWGWVCVGIREERIANRRLLK